MSNLEGDFGLSLDPAAWLSNLTRWNIDPWQAQFLQSSGDVIVLCSRQSGKTQMSSALALHQAVYVPGSLILVLSVGQRQSMELSRKVSDLITIARIGVKEESETRIELTNRSRIINLPASEATIRGYSAVSMLILDEAARIPDSLYHAVTPMVSTSRGRIIMISTAFLKQGFFHSIWTNPDSHFTKISVTADQVPRISKEFLDGERKTMPEAIYQAEYFNKFINLSEYQVFSVEDLEKCVSDKYQAMEI